MSQDTNTTEPTTQPAVSFEQMATALLASIPDTQKQAAASLLTQYGPRLFQMALADAWVYLRRLLAGDLEVVAELDLKLSDDAFIAKVKTNTARWENVAAYNKLREDMKNEMLLKLAPVVVSILFALVGL